MATFAEIQQQLTMLRQRREIFLHLLDHIDTSFLPGENGKDPEKVLVTDDQVRVPESAFEAVSGEITGVINQIDQAMQAIQNSQVTPATPAAPAPAAPQENASGSEQPAVDPQPRGARRRGGNGG